MGSLDVLARSVRQASVIDDTSNRPWPAPDEPWVQAQSWVELAFLHWRVDDAEVQRLLPEWVELETFDGSAWVGIVPFRIVDFRLRGLPPLPFISRWPELNVRTCVTCDGKPGVWFFSLDASSPLVVEAGKRLFSLPYHRAQMRSERHDDFLYYESARAGGEFSARYRGEGPLFHAEPGSLEWFLVERYCLYTENAGTRYRLEIHHPPWDLQRGKVDVDRNTMSPVSLPDEHPHALFSPRQDVVLWSSNRLTP